MIWAEANEKSDAWQARQAALEAEANAKRSAAAQARPRADDGTLASGATGSGTTGPKKPNRATKAKAAASGTNRGTAERMDALRRKRPDLAAKRSTGAMKPTEAMRAMKKGEVVAKVRAIVDEELPGLMPTARDVAATTIQLEILERAEILMQQRMVMTAPAAGTA